MARTRRRTRLTESPATRGETAAEQRPSRDLPPARQRRPGALAEACHKKNAGVLAGELGPKSKFHELDEKRVVRIVCVFYKCSYLFGQTYVELAPLGGRNRGCN